MIAIFELCCGNGIASKISINGKVARCERFRPGENVMSQEVKEFKSNLIQYQITKDWIREIVYRTSEDDENSVRIKYFTN